MDCRSMVRIVFLVAASIWFCLPCCPGFAMPGETEEDDAYQTDAPADATTKFNITFKKGINSLSAVAGQKVEAFLPDDLKIKAEVLAPAGSIIYGHVETLNPSRKFLESALSKTSKFKRHSSLVIKFDRIVTPAGQELHITGMPCRQLSVFSTGHVFREIEVGAGGEILKTGDNKMVEDQEFGICFPKSWITFKNRLQIDIQPGDQIAVEASVPYGLSVAARVIKTGK